MASKKENNKNKNQNLLYVLLSILLVVLLIGAIYLYKYMDKKNKENEVPYTDVITQIEDR